MQIDWDKTIDDIFADKLSCLRCGSLSATLVAGYTRSPAAGEYSPRSHNCKNKEECDARRLVVVCASRYGTSFDEGSSRCVYCIR